MKRYKTGVTYLTTNYEYRIPQKQVICNLKFFIDLNKVPCIETLWNDIRFKKILRQGRLFDKDKGYPDFVVNVTGYADCKESDVFNKETGRKLALTRAQKEAFIYSRDFYGYCGYILDQKLYDIDSLYDNSKISIDRCKKHIKNDLI